MDNKGALDHQEIKKAPMCFSARLTLVIEGTFLFFMLYLLRINFSIGIVCMTNIVDGTGTNITSDWNTSTTASYNILNPNTSNEIEESGACGELSAANNRFDSEGEFVWEKKLKGFMLSAFFWGYVITQIPGGWLQTKIGSKHVLGIGMFISIIANILLPAAARIHPYLVVTIRFLMGLCHGVVFPGMHALWGKWAPPLERSKLIASTYAGTIIGTVAAMSTSGYVCEIGRDNGWPLIYYIHGVIGLIWWILWNFLVYNSPSVHPRISEEEKIYIETSVGPSAYKKDFPIPWKEIMKSGPMWAIMTGHFCNNWGSYTVLTSVPTYMKEVLHFDIKSNGVLSAVPYICMYFVAMFAGQLADFLRGRKIMSTTLVRKTFQTAAFLVPSVSIIAMGFMDCDTRYFAVAFLTIAIAFTAFGRCAYSINHVDIAPRFSGILFGITNTAATIPGMISPYIAATLTKNGTQKEWQKVFFICGGIYAFGWLIYTIFASGEEQPWAKIDIQEITTDVQMKSLIDYQNNKKKSKDALKA